MTVAMMVAMMLPSVAPTLWRYHRHARVMQMPRAFPRTMLFTAGYVSVWSAVALVLSALPASSLSMWGTAAVFLGAGMLQRSRWKARQLLRCRESCVPARRLRGNVIMALAEGCRLGIDCCLSCAAPMGVLYVMGLMDARMMMLTMAAITAERVAPSGARIARLTGSVALITGLLMCM